MKIISICLTDIPKDKITTSEKNGKRYINLVVDDLKDGPNQYGNDCSVSISQTKEERAAKASRVFVGNGKTCTFQSTPAAPAATAAPVDDDLPF
jgi:hypothetical protein